jgi:hypothetical protein
MRTLTTRRRSQVFKMLLFDENDYQTEGESSSFSVEFFKFFRTTASFRLNDYKARRVIPMKKGPVVL